MTHKSEHHIGRELVILRTFWFCVAMNPSKWTSSHLHIAVRWTKPYYC